MTCDPCETAIQQFLQGTELNVIGTFTDVSGNLIDPTEVSLNIKDPTGTVTPVTATRNSTGIYSAPVVFSLVGTYSIQYLGQGNVVAIQETQILIYASLFS
jgi:hypothetical protein